MSKPRGVIGIASDFWHERNTPPAVSSSPGNSTFFFQFFIFFYTVTIYFVVLPMSNVSASWRNGIASDFDMSGTLPLPWVRVPATPLSFFNFSFFFLNGLLFQKFLEQFQKFLEHLLIVFWTIDLFFEQFTI